MKKTNVYYKYRLEKRLKESDDVKTIYDIHHISESYMVYLTRYYWLSEILEWRWEIHEWLRAFFPKEKWSTLPKELPLRLYLDYKKIT